MQRLLISMLTLLIAFQGMLGSAMAYGMAQGDSEKTALLASFTPPDRASESSEYSGMPCHSTNDDSDSDDAHASQLFQCDTCQICHLSADMTTLLAHASAPLNNTRMAMLAERFTSEVLLRACEPPIS